MPLTDQAPSVRYINFIYWAFSVSSGGAYGDILAITPAESIFQTGAMLFFRVYFAFIAAEVATIFANNYTSFKENLDKVLI